MSIYTWSVVVIAALGVAWFAWALCRAAALADAQMPAPAPAKAKRVYLRGMCPYCGELEVVLRQDGEPSRRHHPCRASESPLVGVWPPAPDDKAVA